MPELTRRRSTDAREECWHVYYGDIHAGRIAIRTGIPPFCLALWATSQIARRDSVAIDRAICREFISLCMQVSNTML
jgi:hypothetical protein